MKVNLNETSKVQLNIIAQEVTGCTACSLSAQRKNPVPGVGSADAKIVIVGEGPGANEDEVGLPFVGRSGKLLDKIIENNGSMARRDIFITNVVKCRPPENRTPRPEEIALCRHYLIKQLNAIRPKVVLCMGSTATQTLTGETMALGKLRGRNLAGKKPAIIATYHPSYGLRMGESIVKLMQIDFDLACTFALEV